MKPQPKMRYAGAFAVLLALLAVLFVWNVNSGSLHLSVREVAQILLTHSGDNAVIVWEIRLPRIFAAILLGGALSVSGFLLQTFFANPIAGPFVLGISSGAKLTVALTMIGALSCGPVLGSAVMITAAFAGAMLSMGFVLLIAQRVRQMPLLVVSGVMILLFKPFKMGDVVRYVDSDITGTVEEITLHHTAVRTVENKRVIIPNSKMNSAIIENADYADSKVCVFLTVGITYESDLKKAKELLAREVRKQPTFLDIRTEQQKKDGVPDVPVVVLELADSAVVLRASLWAKDNATAFALKCAVLEGIKLTYDAEGIDIAYPHMQVVKSEE